MNSVLKFSLILALSYVAVDAFYREAMNIEQGNKCEDAFFECYQWSRAKKYIRKQILKKLNKEADKNSERIKQLEAEGIKRDFADCKYFQESCSVAIKPLCMASYNKAMQDLEKCEDFLQVKNKLVAELKIYSEYFHGDKLTEEKFAKACTDTYIKIDENEDKYIDMFKDKGHC